MRRHTHVIPVLFIHLALPWKFEFLNYLFYDKICWFFDKSDIKNIYIIPIKIEVDHKILICIYLVFMRYVGVERKLAYSNPFQAKQSKAK